MGVYAEIWKIQLNANFKPPKMEHFYTTHQEADFDNHNLNNIVRMNASSDDDDTEDYDFDYDPNEMYYALNRKD